MGLDMITISSEKINLEKGYANSEEWDSLLEDNSIKKLVRWRKLYSLHNWMEELYKLRGGVDVFNCVVLQLYPEDIGDLERDVKERKLNTCTRSYSSMSKIDKEDIKSLKKFIRLAKKSHKAGLQLFYDSWW